MITVAFWAFWAVLTVVVWRHEARKPYDPWPDNQRMIRHLHKHYPNNESAGNP